MTCPLLDKNLLVSAKSSGDASHAEIALLKAEAAIMTSDYSQSLIEMSYLMEAAAVASCLGQRADSSSMLTRFLHFCWNNSAGQPAMTTGGQHQGDDPNEHKALLYLRAARWMNRHVSPSTALTPELILDFHSRCISGRGHHQSGITYRGTWALTAGQANAWRAGFERANVGRAGFGQAGAERTGFGQAGADGQHAGSGTAADRQHAGSGGTEPDAAESSSLEDIYPQLIELCNFMNRNLYSPVIQAIVARLAFEAAVPFDEPTNATLKLLFHTTLRRQGVTRRLIAPVSLLECHYPSLFETTGRGNRAGAGAGADKVAAYAGVSYAVLANGADGRFAADSAGHAAAGHAAAGRSYSRAGSAVDAGRFDAKSRYSWHSDACRPIADHKVATVYPQLNAGVSLAAGAVEMAANALNCLRETVEDLERSWTRRIGHVSKSSLLEEVLALLPAHPLLTVDRLCQLTNRRFTSVNDVVTRLVKAGILKISPIPQTKTRLLTAPDVFSAYEVMLTAVPSRFCLNEAFRVHLLN